MTDSADSSSNDALRQAGLAALAALAGDDAAREVDLLLAAATGRSPAWLRAHGKQRSPWAAREHYAELLKRRQAGEPIAYLLGEWEFWSLPLAVDPAVLIPRPETECLVELVLSRIPVDRTCRIADLGTGSGAIALAIAKERPKVRVVATDISAEALAVAKGNAAKLGLARQVQFHLGDWYGALAGQDRFDLLVSNPPYIAAGDRHLREGDLRFEPLSALVAGRDGLTALRELAAGAAGHLVDGGWLLVEHGLDQGAQVRKLMQHAKFSDIDTAVDLERRERVTMARRGYGR